MIVGLLERLDEQSRARLLAEAFEHSTIAKTVASLGPGTVGDLVEVNTAFCRLVGYDRAELVGRPCAILFDESDRAQMLAGLQALARGERRELEIDRRLTHKDGSRVWVTTRAVVTHDALGARYVVTESVDSSHSHALRSSQELLDVIVSATPDLLLVTTPDGRVVRTNTSWERILGWTETDLRGMDLATLIHPDDAATTSERVRYRARDGAYRWLQWNRAELPGQGLLIAIGRDVSDAVAGEETLHRLLRQANDANAELEAQRAEAEVAFERLSRSERRFAEVFDHSPVAKVVVGLRGTDRGRITLINPAFTQLLGYRREEALDLPVQRLLARPNPDFEPALAALADGERSRTVRESVLRHRDGALVYVASHTSVITDADGPASAVVQLRDVTTERAAAQVTEREFQRLRDTLMVQREVTAAAGDRDAAVRVVAERAVHLFPAADGSVVELLDGDALRYAATAGNLAGAIGTRVPVVGSLSGTVLASGAPAHCRDVTDDPRVNRATCERLGIAAMLIAPLHAGDEVIGALKISATRPGVFDDTDEQQLSLLADSLSAAMRHADDAAHNAALLAERTGALDALEASETRFKLAFVNSPLGLVIISLEEASFGRYLDANPAMSTITGYSAAEFAGMTFQDLQHPDDDAANLDVVARITSGERDTAALERRYRHKDGHIVHVALRIAAVRDEHGRARYLVTQVEDITERRAALAQLHQQAALLRLIPAAVIVRSLDGRILWWNQGAEDLYGWTLAAARGKSTHRLLATSHPGGTGEADQTGALQRQGRWEGQLEHVTAYGHTVTVLSRQVLQHDPVAGLEDGLAGTVLEVNTDVTAARAAERALADSEQRLRAQFTYSAAGQVIRALDGTLIDVNPAYCRMLGYTHEQLAALTEPVAHPDEADTHRHQLAFLFAGDADAYTHEGRVRHADGHWVDTEATVSLIRDPAGRPRHLISVVTDITARRAAERARDLALDALTARNAELEDANRLKLDLIGMLGHEIGNPLAAILGYTEIFTDDWPGLDDAMRGKVIDGISRQAHRLDDIVQEVLDMVRIEAGTIHAERAPLRLRAQIAQALTATLAEHVPVTGDDVTVLVNAGHLQHILTNLISNAAKYGGGATGVGISAGDAGRVRVDVLDRGPGVPEEFRHRLFERLTRADRDASKVKGTGLGLYIVHNLAQANHGDVTHRPNPDGGSIFTVDLEAG
ncbi:PAS domain S-box protein [Dactylosporangium siamense]|uniref:histidine kinase n=1 Tax=Dactylosporangium siamense TaxID=685454 RepID=A0A919PVB0_9ACTN|nr:PAS domain S-box protein [Dactylosporangium siamense]GIG49055.1 hypothetical protein Dsi01nite_070960 [Dactylosporangium siamense]